MTKHFIESGTSISPLSEVSQNPDALTWIRGFIEALAEEEHRPLPSETGFEQLHALRQFGTLFLPRGCKTRQTLGNGPSALPESERTLVTSLMKAVTDPDRGSLLCFHRALVMHLVYSAFGYDAMVLSMGMGPQKGPYDHSINLVQQPGDDCWSLHDSHLGCCFYEDETPADFLPVFQKLANLKPFEPMPIDVALDRYEKTMPTKRQHNERLALHVQREEFFSPEMKDSFAETFMPKGIHGHWANLMLFPKRLMGNKLASQMVEQLAGTLRAAGRQTLLQNDWRAQQRKVKSG